MRLLGTAGALVAMLLGATPVIAASAVDAGAFHGPTEVVLTPDEFAILEEAAREAPDTLTIAARAGGGGNWAIAIPDARTRDALARALTEWTRRSTSRIDWTQGVADSMRARLAAAQEARGRIAAAGAGQTGLPDEIAGELRGAGGTWTVHTDDSDVALDPSALPAAIATLEHREVVARGARSGGTFHADAVFERPHNTLDLFVMSLCPGGQKMEAELLGRYRAATDPLLPALRIHYILYAHADGGTTRFSSLHGDAEVREDLVQIVVRDDYPSAYWKYLGERARSTDPWDAIAARAGLDARAVARVRSLLAKESDTLARREYDEVAQGFGVRDGSPTLLWEGLAGSVAVAAPPVASIAASGRCTSDAATH